MDLELDFGVFQTKKIMQEVYKFDIDGMTVNFPDKLQHLIENENNCKACTHNYYSL